MIWSQTVEHDGGPCPIPVGMLVRVEYRNDAGLLRLWEGRLTAEMIVAGGWTPADKTRRTDRVLRWCVASSDAIKPLYDAVAGRLQGKWVVPDAEARFKSKPKPGEDA